jgi:hypothetical protein
MRPGFIGYAIVWTLLTCVLSYNLMFSAPLLFVIFLVPAGLLLLYGLSADEPALQAPRPAVPGPAGYPASSTTTGQSLSYLPPVPAGPPATAAPASPVPQLGPGFDDAYGYAQTATFGSGKQFVLMVLSTLLLAVPLCGYLVRVLRGVDPAEELQDRGGLLADGIRAWIILVLYTLPAIIVFAVTSTIQPRGAGNPALITFGVLLGLALMVASAYFAPAGLLRFARTGSMSDAFGFGPLFVMIRRIGGLTYTGFLITCLILSFLVEIFAFVPYLGWIIILVLIPPVAIFAARYFVLLYDYAGEG